MGTSQLILDNRFIEATEAEGWRYQVEFLAGELGQDLAITLVSQASLLMATGEARRAMSIFGMAYSHAETAVYRA